MQFAVANIRIIWRFIYLPSFEFLDVILHGAEQELFGLRLRY